MNRVTDKELEAIVGRLNRITNSPAAPYVGSVCQVGNYHLDHAYGGVQLCRMVNESGGVTNVLRGGHVTKRELRDQLFAFIYGIETAQTEALAMLSPK